MHPDNQIKKDLLKLAVLCFSLFLIALSIPKVHRPGDAEMRKCLQALHSTSRIEYAELVLGLADYETPHDFILIQEWCESNLAEWETLYQTTKGESK
jgi:hypothetical protein